MTKTHLAFWADLDIALLGLTLGDKSLVLALLVAFVCFTGVVFAAAADLEEVFVAGFGFVIPVFTLSDLDAIFLLGITWKGLSSDIFLVNDGSRR